MNLKKSGNFRYGPGIFNDVSHGSRLAYRLIVDNNRFGL